ncbi:MAG TPA: glucodextranase DOMON-like domain-containing protein [Solirubrobacteraceae bacterium]|nr:glucodextranase DOMON-like domain-containing protein [Solirubrobacteraceae bacterium]
MRRRSLIALLAAGALIACLVPAAASATVAPGAPGSDSYFDLARKDCVGTARNTNSKIWFTVADGVLSDTYWPTVDATNVHTLQYLVTDGKSFTDLQTRDMTYKVLDDPTGMACTVIASDAVHHYKIRTTFLTDPSRDAVLMRTRFEGPSRDQLYVRLDPLAGGTGGGGTQNGGGNTASLATVDGGPVPVASNTNTTTNAANRDYAVPTFEALEASSGFSSASVGYAGTDSDGLNMLDSGHQLTTYDSAPDGHVALTAQIRLRHGRSAELALGFGTTESNALAVAGASLGQRFHQVRDTYESQWQRYDAGLRRPSARLGRAAVREYYESVNVVKASEDKTFAGAIAAGLGSPWGQSVPADTLVNGEPMYFGSYRETFARDLYEEFTGLLVAGDVATARAATRFLFDRQQQPDGSMPRNSLTNGKPAPDTGGVQLDETSYPILMDWQSGLAGDAGLYTQHVIPAADFLVAHGPSDGVERWEEQTGYSPSTIAAEIAGLTAAARIASVNGDRAHARVYQATADDFARNIKAWTVTTNGPYISTSVPSYFIRIAKAADPNSAEQVGLGNGSITVDQRSLIDAGFLDLVRLGVLPASDPVVRSSLTVVDDTIMRDTPSGPGFYRYGTSDPGSEDGYGDCYEPDPTSCSPTGAPWAPTDTGSGHLWPVLDGERGEYDVADGHSSSAGTLLAAMRNMTSGQGLEPEQAWEDPAVAASPFGTDPATASIGFEPGHPAGSASPLGWAQAQYARLALDVSAGRNLETPQIVTDRYVAHGMPGTVPLTVTSPSPGMSVDTATVPVSGTTAPRARVVAEASGTAGGTAAIASTTADSNGDWTLSLPSNFGSTTITVTATLGDRTAYDQLSVTDVALPGTSVLSVMDPTGDDNGPGTYAYPTASDFHAGAFDLTGMKVSETDSDVYIQVSLANLDPTFGAAFGAQLLDVYVRNPAASNFSTSAAFLSRNYSIAAPDAWSERVEAQGFAPVVWDDASGASLGSAQLVADQTSKTATVILPRSAFGDVGSGWVFTATLTGQDGFSSDQARAFTATPGPDTFGVCATAGSSPICALGPNTVPKVMDTITPPGVSQDTELDPTQGPVTIQGVTAP